jgi:hypothetical protein
VVLAVVSAGSRALAVETDGLVDHELADQGVAGSDTSNTDDESEREQLNGDVLELSETLGDGVASLVLLGNGSPQASRRSEEHARGRAHKHAASRPEHAESNGGVHFD